MTRRRPRAPVNTDPTVLVQAGALTVSLAPRFRGSGPSGRQPYVTALANVALWQRVQDRKAQTRARYMRTPAGTLLSKSESGINGTSALLTGFLRCAVCGGGLAHVRKNNKSKRYYYVERSRRGATVCSNSAGVPMKALDDHVLLALNEALTDEDQVWDLIPERANRWKREHERPKKERENMERQVKRIEAEIANLTRQAARGLDIDVQEFNSRRAEVEELRRKLEAPAEIDLDRDALRAGLTMVKHFKGGLTLIDDPSKDYIEMKLDPVVGPLATKRDPAGTRSRCASWASSVSSPSLARMAGTSRVWAT